MVSYGNSPKEGAAKSNNEIAPQLPLSSKEYAIFEEHKQLKVKFTILGQLPSMSPGQACLSKWAEKSLHPSLVIYLLVGNEFFEARFSSKEGVHNALSKTFFLDGKEVFLRQWTPFFRPDYPGDLRFSDYHVWLQFLELNEYLRNETCLRIIVGKCGKVLVVEESETYVFKTAGLRVKVLVSDHTDSGGV